MIRSPLIYCNLWCKKSMVYNTINGTNGLAKVLEVSIVDGIYE